MNYIKRIFSNWFANSDKIRNNILQAVPFWIASIATGLLSFAYTKLFNLCEQTVTSTLHINGLLIFALAPVNFLLAWYVVDRFAPYARGSGIPQVMAAIELPSKSSKKISLLLGMRVVIVKIASSLLMVLGGGAIGREGPTIQISSSVFYLFNKWMPSVFTKLSQKSYFITGAAAGLAAAFNTPLGGIVFAIEELARIHVSFFRTALFSAVIISGLTAQALLGPYLYLGYPEIGNLDRFIFLGVAATAIITGFLGAAMSKAILRVITWKSSFDRKKTILTILAIALIMAAISYFIDNAILGSGKDLMHRVLFSNNKTTPITAVFARIIGPILSFNVGSAGGIFAPALSAGAAVGSYISGLAGFVGANSNILILCGMVGFLTGVTRTPMTSAILVLEMTDRHNVIFHLMFAALLSSISALIVDRHSLYEYLRNKYLEELDEDTREAPAEPIL